MNETTYNRIIIIILVLLAVSIAGNMFFGIRNDNTERKAKEAISINSKLKSENRKLKESIETIKAISEKVTRELEESITESRELEESITESIDNSGSIGNELTEAERIIRDLIKTDEEAKKKTNR